MVAVSKSSLNKIATHPLQTWEWGEFRTEWGNEVVRFPFGQIVINKIPKTSFKIGTFIRGIAPTQKIINELKKYSQENNIVYIKFEPNVLTETTDLSGKKIKSHKEGERVIKLLQKNGAVVGRTLFTPTSFQIDLSLSEDELLSGFHKKTRYNIRLAARHGVKVKEDNSQKAFDRYIDLTRETTKRQRFYAHTEKYHRLMWRHLNTDMKTKPIAHLLTAIYQNQIITTWILFIWKDTLYYPYGASTFEHKKVMANNLMMWEAIKFGKRHKLKTFDLWGREPGKGFTPFKEGYNPNIVKFVGTWDLIINPAIYYPLRASEHLRWKVLKFKSKFTEPDF